MLVDDSVSRGGSLVASTAPGEKGGNISLLDLPMEREGREYCCCRTCPLRCYAALLYYTGWLGGWLTGGWLGSLQWTRRLSHCCSI
eukprot:COSAG06_NODE_1314_length_9887_cov_10.607070_7_plen_86_part_00